MKINTKALQFYSTDKEKAVFWSIVFAIFFSIFIYIFLIHASIYNIVVAKEATREIRNLQSELLEIEQDYLQLTDRLDLEFALAQGFQEVPEQKTAFVDRSTRAGLTLGDNE